jgi:hypothetical protein
MQRIYQQSHVEMHLIGPRCSNAAWGLWIRNPLLFGILTEFSPISIKMAKAGNFADADRDHWDVRPAALLPGV